jgi:general secretion pathway protein A
MDYFQILNLKKEPFSNSPEPDFFFQSEQHRGCLQKLELAIRLRRGLNVVMGEVGTGKTTLCRQLILNFSQTEEDRRLIETHLILDPSFSGAEEFLSAVSLLLGTATSSDGKSEWQLKENIKNYLFKRGVDEGKTVVLIIDEGQKLPDFCLEILREFLNYETNQYKLLQIVVFAQKEFEQVLKDHANFADRVNQYYYLQPLNFRDARAMINFRLATASADPAAVPKIFTWPALWAIHRATDGYPRKIITLCHQAMLAMIIQNRSRAGYSLVRSCAGRVTPAEAARWPRWVLILTCAGLLLFFGIMNYGQMDFFSLGREKAIVKALPPAMTQTQIAPSPVKPIPVVVEQELIEETPPLLKEPQRATPLKKRPDMLGHLKVNQNDCVLAILERVYGKEAILRLGNVARANPHIKDLDRVRKGDIINIPARLKESNPLPDGKCWVQIASFDNLRSAYELMTEASSLPRLIMISYWHEREGAVFAVFLKEGFADEAAALSALKSLPPPLASGARVVKSWREGVRFL